MAAAAQEHVADDRDETVRHASEKTGSQVGTKAAGKRESPPLHQPVADPQQGSPRLFVVHGHSRMGCNMAMSRMRSNRRGSCPVSRQREEFHPSQTGVELPARPPAAGRGAVVSPWVTFPSTPSIQAEKMAIQSGLLPNGVQSQTSKPARHQMPKHCAVRPRRELSLATCRQRAEKKEQTPFRRRQSEVGSVA